MPAKYLPCFLMFFSLAVTDVYADNVRRLELGLPLDCRVGPVCMLQNLVDHDLGAGFKDYNCGSVGYDGHKGTDIRLPNLAMMRQGVPVLAAADGRVRAIRDAMPDISVRAPGRLQEIQGREAGNSVAITHGDGWETQYSHLRLGSVMVKPGDKVKTGQQLGLVGLSGKSEFPHLHISVRHKGKIVDPFIGIDGAPDCGLGHRPLWNQAALNTLSYQSTGLLQSGFAGGKPDIKMVEAGDYHSGRLPPDAAALVFWVEVINTQKGDRETLMLESPDGEVLFRKEGTMPRNKARWFSYAGKRRPSDAWMPGTYRASYKLEREIDGRTESIIDEIKTVTIPHHR